MGLVLLFVSVTGVSCLKGAEFLKPSASKEGSSNRSPTATQAPLAVSQSQVSGTTLAKVSSQSTVTQELTVPTGSDVSGTTVSFPAGSLSIDTEISVQESVPVATVTATAELGIQTIVTPASKAVAVQSTAQVDPIQPFTVSLVIPERSLSAPSLSLQNDNLLILYRVHSYTEGKTLVGVIPTGEITKDNNVVKFNSRYFGAFQAAYSSVPVTKPQTATSTVPVQTKKEVLDLPPMAVTSRTPVVVSSGSVVTIFGRNFRPTVAVALGGKKVGDLKVLSDSQASFVAPVEAEFGLNSIDLLQDGVAQTISIFYRGNKTDFPIITDVPENVCTGTSFYDQSGALRMGSKICQTTPPPALCSRTGETNCLTSSTFPAVASSELAADRIRKGASIGGVVGVYPSLQAPLTGNTATTDLTSFGPATPVGVYEFFDSHGGVYTATVADGGTVTPGTYDQTLSAAGTMYRSATISGDADLTASKILSGTNLFGVTGTVTAAPANCSTNGSQNCVAAGPYFAAAACTTNGSHCFVPTYTQTSQPLKAISYDAIDAAKASIRSTLTLGGVSGTLLDCTANNTSGCVTTSTYKSADWTNLTAANIKNGVTVAGLTGTYPSTGNLLSGADATTDLDGATFDAKIKSSGTFEWFSPNGSRYTYAGDTDIAAGNITSGVTIFGTIGTAAGLTQCTSSTQAICTSDTACRWNAGVCEINPWNIRAGITVASKEGSLKTNCRNTINSSRYNWDGPVTSLPNSEYTGGFSLDFWDTIDGYRNDPPTKVAAWSAHTQCDSSNWTDVTTIDGGTSFTTCGTSGTCIYRDELSGLRVTGVLSSGTATNTGSPATYSWNAAINACASSTYGGYAAGTWRLPTQKELMALYHNGISSQVSSSFHTLSNLQDDYWSATSSSDDPDQGWVVGLASGSTTDDPKSFSSSALCVF